MANFMCVRLSCFKYQGDWDLQIELGMDLWISEIFAHIGKEYLHLFGFPAEDLYEET